MTKTLIIRRLTLSLETHLAGYFFLRPVWNWAPESNEERRMVLLWYFFWEPLMVGVLRKDAFDN